jgi:GcrA cell cycle regulator
MEWTDEVIERLKAYWAEGHSTAEIGRRMGVSKNAVVGKAHRLALDARPSPIRRAPAGEAPRRAPIRRTMGPTLPPLCAQPEPSAPVPVAPVRSAPPVLRSVHRAPGGRIIPCCWPIGEPGTRSFRFCDAESAAGKPYCAEHAALAYVKIRDRREDAA